MYPRELSHPGAQWSEIKFVNIWSRKAPGVFELSASFGSCRLFVLSEILWKTSFITLPLTVNMISTLIQVFFRYKCILKISWYPLLDIWSRKYREGLIAREPSQAGWLGGADMSGLCGRVTTDPWLPPGCWYSCSSWCWYSCSSWFWWRQCHWIWRLGPLVFF